MVWKYAQMHQNTFLSTPEGQKNHFWRNVSGGLEMCANACKHVFKHSRRSKISFLKKKFLVVWKHVQMHQNTFLPTPDCKKYIFWKKVSGVLEVCANASKHVFKHSWRSKKSSGGVEVCANALKHVFQHSWRSKKHFLKKCFWWSGNVRKWIKIRF